MSRRQTWDLGLLFAAGLVSTALFSAPLLLLLAPPPQGASVQPEPDVAGGPVKPGTPGKNVQHVQIVTALQAAVVTVPELREGAAGRRHSGPRRAAGAPEWRPVLVTRAYTPRIRKLGRLVAGDGRYVVRPFPTIVRPFPTIDQEQR